MLRIGMVLALVACGDNLSVPADASLDAAPDAAIDAPTCAAPMTMCGAACVELDTDETNCGACGMTCKGGEACTGTCACPAPFVPATITPSGFDIIMAAGGGIVAVAPTFGTGLHPVLIGYATSTPLDTDIDLSMVALGSLPFVGAAYNFSVTTGANDASYVVTAGTLRLTTACETEVEGTLTDVTFRGVNGGVTSPMLDPDGCTFAVPLINFHIRTAACP